ncbi:MAG: hypothetical protein JW787_17205 [Sedimentisphaerales bacterium]|nr:hypothetical protein [Sedimentisphaerales bacterium]
MTFTLTTKTNATRGRFGQLLIEDTENESIDDRFSKSELNVNYPDYSRYRFYLGDIDKTFRYSSIENIWLNLHLLSGLIHSEITSPSNQDLINRYLKRLLENNATTEEDTPIVDNLETSIRDIFRIAHCIALEDMTEYDLKEQLASLLNKYNTDVINQIFIILLDNNYDVESISIVLKILGDIDNNSTYESRRMFLEQILIEDRSPIIRDGANIGLSYMDNPKSIPAFEEAIKNCNSLLLRKMLNITLQQLEKTKNASITHDKN